MEKIGHNSNCSISVVMCTFNGERYLKEQIDSILRQTYPVSELIVQDDCSTDNTCSIIEAYAVKYPFIKLYRNERQLGINQNFFSAMQRAHGDFIAISDQDDIWEDNKLELQVNAIGDKMLCTGKSHPFTSEKDILLTIDMRPANYNLLRFLFTGGAFGGHTMMLTPTLLNETLQLSPFFPDRFMYDILLGFVAAAHDSIAYIGSPLVRHRRHRNNATKTYYNPTGNRKTSKILFNTVIETWHLYRKLRPQIIDILRKEEKFLARVPSQKNILQDTLKIVRLYSSRYLIDFIRLSFFCARRGNLLTFSQKKKSLSTYLYGFFFPIYSAGYYKRLL